MPRGQSDAIIDVTEILAGDTPYVWNGTDLFKERFWPKNETETIEPIDPALKPVNQLKAYKNETSKHKCLRQALEIVKAPESVNRAGIACCSQCSKRQIKSIQCAFGCITRTIDGVGRCAECAGQSTDCDFGFTDAKVADSAQLATVAGRLHDKLQTYAEELDAFDRMNLTYPAAMSQMKLKEMTKLAQTVVNSVDDFVAESFEVPRGGEVTPKRGRKESTAPGTSRQ